MSYQIEQFRENYRASVIPRYYSGIAHALFSASTLLGSLLICFSRVQNARVWEWLLVPLLLLLGELLVFVIHKYPLHRPMRWSAWSFRIHALQHHHFFTHEHITWKSTRDFHIMLFPPQVILGFVCIGQPLLFLIFWAAFGANAAWIAAGMGATYFLLYEFVHFCSHLPLDHGLMRIPGMRAQREFHRMHHNPELMARHNFGIVFPLWDYLFGTSIKSVGQNPAGS